MMRDCVGQRDRLSHHHRRQAEGAEKARRGHQSGLVLGEVVRAVVVRGAYSCPHEMGR
jgi:hypothetical protein